MRFRYCPQCAAPLVTGPIGGKEREHCPGCGFVGFHNPAPVGMALIEYRGGLVLIRRAAPPLAGAWAPPAGYVEVGESVPEAVVREAKEECGLAITLDRLVGVYSHAEVGVILVVYGAHATDGEPVAGDDASDVGVFPPGSLADDAPPAGGPPIDLWFHRLIREVTASARGATPAGSTTEGARR